MTIELIFGVCVDCANLTRVRGLSSERDAFSGAVSSYFSLVSESAMVAEQRKDKPGVHNITSSIHLSSDDT